MSYPLKSALRVRTGTEPVVVFYLSSCGCYVWHAYGKNYNTSDILNKSFSLCSAITYSLIEHSSEVLPRNEHWRYALTGAFGVGLLADYIEDHLLNQTASDWLVTHFGGENSKDVTPNQLLEALRNKYTELSGVTK